ncbi:RdRP-domain-containing protein [Rhizodiscina lignyota]|uniref:RNA-dependent RNA polymerase n=1 Tax=Rhizodiscina lignyota TaxID=1504668 RepID=A0A9P4ISC0_9PEZI|nr:RdRP-domain-containing protein [Rhizodiscina lignyota]
MDPNVSTSDSTKELLSVFRQARVNQQARKPTPPKPTRPLLRPDSDQQSNVIYAPQSRIGTTTDYQRATSSPAFANSGATPKRPLVHGSQDWRGLFEVKIRVNQLPWAVSTLDLYRVFSREGRIFRIEVIGENTAYVTFSPPPHRAFWQGVGQPVTLRDSENDREIPLICTRLEPRGRYGLHQSPVDPVYFYPQRITLYLDSLDLGFMYGEKSMMTMCSVKTEISHSVEFTLNLRFREITIMFHLPRSAVNKHPRPARPNAKAEFRFRIPLETLHTVFETFQSDEERELVFSVTSPPEYFRKTDNIEATHDPRLRTWDEWRAWYRQTDIVSDAHGLAASSVRLRKESAVVDIGRWRTFCLKLGSQRNQKTTYDIFCRALRDYNVHFLEHEPIARIMGDGKEAAIWQTLDLPPIDAMSPSATLLQLDTIHLAFRIRYQLEVCISLGCINEHNISREFLEQLVIMKEDLAVRHLEKAAESQVRYFDPMKIFDLRLPRQPRKAKGGHYTYMRAAQVSPSMIYYATPVLETSNRIIRQFFAFEDRFLRVKFVDERGKIFAKEDSETQEAIFDRIMRAMNNGIRIGDRHYEFLAFGNSQFREHGAYFFASTETLRAQHIRTWMGDLTDIRVVAKWAARLGQAFSTTRSIHGVHVEVKGEEDIVRNGYTFTDGVGRISVFLAKMIAKEFGIDNINEEYPSLFQFRMGGCKGVLAVDPQIKGIQELIIRRSQYKFPAKHEGLDVIRYSSFAVSMLNRQIITLLSALGVADAVFMRKLENELIELADAMKNEKIALSLLQKRIDFNQMTLTVAAMILDGFMRAEDPFMMSVLHLWRAWNIRYLKEKARITIDQGAFLLGCVDETETLHGYYKEEQPGQFASAKERIQSLPEIFVQVRDPPFTGPYKVKAGVCMLARNPSLHPGDIRIVKAVDVPELRHLKDVVVLPRTGDRDLANMCSGGDLDGDDYMVLWDHDLLPPYHHWNIEAMDFRPPKPDQIDREVRVEDITKFFITYIKNDQLPRIAHAHLAWSDISDVGVFDSKCLKLAELHALAVDYPKSGRPAKMTRELKPKEWPHFMEKAKDKTYRSGKVLGRMYDRVSLIDFKPFYNAPFDKRILDAYKEEQSAELLGVVKGIKSDYDDGVRRIMAKHAIETEFEVWTTFVLQHNTQSNDYKFHEEIGNLTSALKDRFREICIEKAGGAEISKLGAFVVAMYKVTADEITTAVAECGQTKTVGGREVPKRRMLPKFMPLMSFPWLFPAELGKIASGKHISSAANMAALQGMQKKTRHHKRVDDQAQTIGDVETKAGVVHPGEELLLFDDAEKDRDFEDAEHVAMVESGKHKVLEIIKRPKEEDEVEESHGNSEDEDNDRFMMRSDDGSDSDDDVPVERYAKPSLAETRHTEAVTAQRFQEYTAFLNRNQVDTGDGPTDGFGHVANLKRYTGGPADYQIRQGSDENPSGHKGPEEAESEAEVTTLGEVEEGEIQIEIDEGPSALERLGAMLG